MIVSPSVSLVAAGLASGICLLLFSTIRKRRSLESKESTSRIVPVDDSRCGCCLKPFLIGRGVECGDCNIRSCRNGCSRWDTDDNAWHCLFCHQRRSWLKRNEKWFEVFGGANIEEELHRYFSTAKSKVYVAGVENGSSNSSLELAESGKEEKNTMETVRDFVEKIVEGLIGNVDDTPIDRLYAHPAYDELLGKYNAPLAGALVRLALSLRLSLTNKPNVDPPAMAHRALCELVERAVDEARKLPSLASAEETARPDEGRSIADQSYEDLLATAILNKVIEKVQKDGVDGNSNVLHEHLAARTKSALSESELGLDEGVDEGSSSLEPLSQDDGSSECSTSRSRGIRNRTEPVSLMIEERIEEVTTTYTSDEENREAVDNNVLLVGNARRVPFPEYGMDIVDPSQESSDESQDEIDKDDASSHVALVTPLESWEENWLFQKKKVQHARADAVAMLVPNPSADYKALIGDKDAEDTSDLSECSAQSDEEIEMELRDAIENVVPRSPRTSESEDRAPGLEDSPKRLAKDAKDETTVVVVVSEYSSTQQPRRDKLSPEQDAEENSKEECVPGVAEGLTSSDKVPSGNWEAFNKTEVEDVPGTSSVEGIPVIRVDESEPNDDSESSEEHLPDSAESKDTGVANDFLPDMDETHDASQAESNSETLDDISLTIDETVIDVPRTPRTPNPTPSRASITDNQEGGAAEGDAEVADFGTSDEAVLNSLESAKQKLMHASEEDLSRTSFDGQYCEEEPQQESEYTEHYDTATQRRMDSLTKTDPDETINEDEDRSLTQRENKSNCSDTAIETVPESSEKQEQIDEDSQLTAPPRPGTIAEREHKKWENAAPIENNPYSEENIQKRLWERQYSRRLSDIPGAHTELSKDLDALEPTQPDIQRFGRDYYINQSKSASGERTRRSPTSSSSRPGSSLSQRSDSIGTDHERQEGSPRKETDVSCIKSNDVKAKVAKWQQNNAEANRSFSTSSRNREGSVPTISPTEEKYLEKSEKDWQDEGMESFLENERKNSKNEINAKLNNQENSYDGKGMMETRKCYGDERRTIRRIDLKAYGFEKDFGLNSSETAKTSAQRVVNKLDLKSFGYDDGSRGKCQSNNQLDDVEGEFKPRSMPATDKSNLTRYNERQGSVDAKTSNCKGSVLAKSTETLNNLQDESRARFPPISSAKSVPDLVYVNASDCRRLARSNTEGRPGQITNFLRRDESARKLDSLNGSLESEIGGSSLDDDASMDSREAEGSEENASNIVEKELTMPSVKSLARAFCTSPESAPLPAPRLSKSSGALKERSTTPEAPTVCTPKQMHSLTARSLSKQFRESLRQMPNKVTSPPASHVAMESVGTGHERRQIVRAKSDDVTHDVAVISPGKLRSNIIFWEELQRRS